MLKALVTCVAICFMLAPAASAEPVPEKTETVIVTGVGTDADKARQNAVRNAVEQVVGSYIKSETAVSNSALIKDEILSHSGGYAQSTRVISVDRTDDGLVSVRLEARITSTRLVRKLNELNIAVKKVDDGLFTKALSRLDTDRSRTEESAAGKVLLEDVVKKFPAQAYQIAIGEVSVESASDATKTARVKIPLKITWDSDFIGELMQTMKQTSGFSSEFEDLMAVNNRMKEHKADGEFQSLYCFTEKAVLADLVPEYCGVMSAPTGSFYKGNSEIVRFIKLMRGGHDVLAKLKVTFKAADNRKLKVIYSDLKSDNYKQQHMDRIRTKRISSLDSLTYTPPRGNLPNGIAGPYGKIILVDGEYNIAVDTELTIDTLQKVKSIEVVVEAAERI